MKTTLSIEIDGLTLSASLEGPAESAGTPLPGTGTEFAASVDAFASAETFARRLQEGVPGLLRVLESAVADRYQAWADSIKVNG